MISAVDYDAATTSIIEAAKQGRPFAVSALAVHGVMTGVQDAAHKYRLNSFDLVVPDGQPVRWALNLLYRTKLADRVYGPSLTLRLLRAAADESVPVYFYGTNPEILHGLLDKVKSLFPRLVVAGYEPSRFRPLDNNERLELSMRIRESGAKLLFVGLGCPRQEIFAYEMRELISMPLIAVGAAFAFIADQLPQSPPLLQKYGLEWLYRLKQEPKRLWRRYLYLNPHYLLLLLLQLLGKSFPTDGVRPSAVIGPG